MPEIITTLTGFEVKPGESGNGPYILSKFAADDGKKYQTFDEELAERMKARIGKPSKLEFEVQSRTSGNRTFTNNVVTDISDPSASTVDASGGGSSAVMERLAAFQAAESVVSTLVASGQSEDYSFLAIVGAADNILAWAEGNLAGSDPEDAVPDADPSDAVPD